MTARGSGAAAVRGPGAERARERALRPADLALSKSGRRVAGPARRRTLYEEALAVIERDYRSPLTVEGLARSTFASRRHLQRAFAESGTSVSDRLLAVRMDRGAELLRDPRRTVEEVARAVGYRQPSQFAKAFRRRHGCPPSQWRERTESALAA